jgi:hypothetical protein
VCPALTSDSLGVDIATTFLSLIDASKLQPTPQYEQVVLTFSSTATDFD